MNVHVSAIVVPVYSRTPFYRSERATSEVIDMYVKRVDRLSQLHHINNTATTTVSATSGTTSFTSPSTGVVSGVTSINGASALHAPVVQHIRSATWRGCGTAAARCSGGVASSTITISGNGSSSSASLSSLSASSMSGALAPSRNEPHPLIAAAAAAAATAASSNFRRRTDLESDNKYDENCVNYDEEMTENHFLTLNLVGWLYIVLKAAYVILPVVCQL